MEKILFDSILGNRLYAAAGAWISLTSHEAAQIRGAGIHPTRIHVIPNGIGPRLYMTNRSRIDFAREFGIEHPDAPWILYVGRLHETKGLEILLKSFERMKTRVEHAQMLVVGPHDKSALLSKSQTLNHQARGVYLLGSLPENVKFQALTLSDVLVTPTFYGFPTTFLEAMLVGTPIVACAGSGLEEELSDVITFAETTERLAETIVNLLTDSASLSRIRALSTSLATRAFDIRLIARRHVALYSDLLSASGTSVA